MENYKLVEKGYSVDMKQFNEGFMSDGISCSAKSLGKAKVILLNKLLSENWEFKDKDKYKYSEVTFINIPVSRNKEKDKFQFEDQVLTEYKINALLYTRKRDAELNSILNDENIEYCYIKKRGCYYMSNNCGYTDYIHLAGIYKKEEAVNSAKMCQELFIIPIDKTEHNKMINEQMEKLKIKII